MDNICRGLNKKNKKRIAIVILEQTNSKILKSWWMRRQVCELSLGTGVESIRGECTVTLAIDVKKSLTPRIKTLETVF